MKLIDKDIIVAELERRMQELHPTNTHQMQVGGMDRDILMWLNALTWVKKILDTLEIKEVDLEKEYDNEFFKDPVFGKLVNRNAGISIAKHFFELGMQQSNNGNNNEEKS